MPCDLHRLGAIAALFVALCVRLAAAAAPLPAYVVLPPGMGPGGSDQLNHETYGEAEFYPDPLISEPTVKRGKYWRANLIMSGVPGDTAGKALWERLKPGFLKAGWAVQTEYDSNPFSVQIRLRKSPIDSWAYIRFFGADDIRMDLVEIGAPPFSHTLPVPAAAPEKVAPDRGDFPYLTPLPGSKFKSGSPDSGTMEVKLPGAEEAEVVATGTITKTYKGPEGLSVLLFVTAYADAMTKAGWTIIEKPEGIQQSDGSITARYAANGRNIWTYMHVNSGEYTIKVGDTGGRDLGAELTKSCHVALDGVLFDFNKATLKPESGAVLDRVQALLKKEAALKVEIQGHTDGVGGDAYNVTLSEGRARAVAAWLAAHGVAADRLSARGYGKTVPVADNDSPEGRARNRRVEVSKPGCKPK